MKLFTCSHCGQLLYFENTRCERCGHSLGFLASRLALVPLVPQGPAAFRLYKGNSMSYRYCTNSQYNVCNWLVPEGSGSGYCEACEFNRTIPDISNPEYRDRWRVIEWAKHRLIYALLRLNLLPGSKKKNPEAGLGFDFLADTGGGYRILTGHASGLITFNIAEADDIEREMTRRQMKEAYRTVLGHFRHEVGHYYWDRLIAGTDHEGPFRNLFGDERTDYGQALQRHYGQGAPPDWNERFISAYASTHPWEDWAETWAHYLHLLDTLETGYAFGIRVEPASVQPGSGLTVALDTDPYQITDFSGLLNRWLPLTFALNSLNRSMGLHDLYPFVIPPLVMEKLGFIHEVCQGARAGSAVANQS